MVDRPPVTECGVSGVAVDRPERGRISPDNHRIRQVIDRSSRMTEGDPSPPRGQLVDRSVDIFGCPQIRMTGGVW